MRLMRFDRQVIKLCEKHSKKSCKEIAAILIDAAVEAGTTGTCGLLLSRCLVAAHRMLPIAVIIAITITARRSPLADHCSPLTTTADDVTVVLVRL